MYLSVIIPYYNEKENISDNLIQIYDFFKNKFEFEIILVDDSGRKNFSKIFT